MNSAKLELVSEAFARLGADITKGRAVDRLTLACTAS